MVGIQGLYLLVGPRHLVVAAPPSRRIDGLLDQGLKRIVAHRVGEVQRCLAGQGGLEGRTGGVSGKGCQDL